MILHEVRDAEDVALVCDGADRGCLVAEKLEVSQRELKRLLLIDLLVRELLDGCEREIALEAGNRLLAAHLENFGALVKHIREGVVKRLEILVNGLELRADNVPMEVVQLDVADTNVGDIGVKRLRKILLTHNLLPLSLFPLQISIRLVSVYDAIIVLVFLFVNSNY